MAAPGHYQNAWFTTNDTQVAEYQEYYPQNSYKTPTYNPASTESLQLYILRSQTDRQMCYKITMYPTATFWIHKQKHVCSLSVVSANGTHVETA